jgi:glycosyltransferase involved in cell wall biosynthesis
MLNNPKITVLMPVYNAEAFLNEAIDSILAQTFTDFEFLIINDGSTDASREIILSYNDQRIRFVENERNLRLIATLNKGIDISFGKYIARMDADDISHPERLNTQFEFMESNLDIGLCGAWFQTFSYGEKKQTVRYQTEDYNIRIKHLYQIHLSHGTCMIRKEVLKRNNLYFNQEFLHAEDYELWTRISEFSKLANIPQVLYKVRNNINSVSNAHRNIQIEHTKNIIIKQFRRLKDDFTEMDYDLYIKFAYSEFGWFNKQRVECLDKLLSQLQFENERKLYLPVLKLKDYWSNKLFHTCYNVPNCFDIWKNSNFYDPCKMNFPKKIKKFFRK